MNENCVFCKIIKNELPCYKIYEDEIVISFLSIDPESYGHTLIIPKEHYVDYTDIPLEVITHINKIGKEMFERLNINLKTDGIKLIQNNGIIQEVKHYHLHLIPVYKEEKLGKENFEEVLNDINKKVLVLKK